MSNICCTIDLFCFGCLIGGKYPLLAIGIQRAWENEVQSTKAHYLQVFYQSSIPRDEISAGFRLLGQCCHCLRLVLWQISATRWLTYCFQGLATCIQWRVGIESVQWNFGKDSNKQPVMLLIRWLKMMAPSSSDRGMVCLFSHMF